MSYVYFIRDPLTRSVKIGVSVAPWLRFSKIQADCPVDLALISAVPGEAEEEAALHARFAAYRVRGEWFSEVGELAAFVATLPPAQRPKRQWKREPITPLDGWLMEGAITAQELADRLGVGKAFVSQMRHGVRQPPLPLAVKLSECTGLSVADFVVRNAA